MTPPSSMYQTTTLHANAADLKVPAPSDEDVALFRAHLENSTGYIESVPDQAAYDGASTVFGQFLNGFRNMARDYTRSVREVEEITYDMTARQHFTPKDLLRIQKLLNEVTLTLSYAGKVVAKTVQSVNQLLRNSG